jgi:hypothetical protein
MSYSVSVSKQTAAAEMESAVKKMEDEGVQSYILDLRNNPVSLFLSQRVYTIFNFYKKRLVH